MFEAKLLRVLHVFIALGDLIKHWVCSISVRFPYQWKNLQLKSDAKDLPKVPTHLGVIICEKDFSFPDIANIIVWSIAFGVSYFSIYDFNGYLKRKHKELKEEIDHAQRKYLNEEPKRCTIVIQSDTRQTPPVNGYYNTNQIDIQLLSNTDGRQGLVDTTRLLCQQVASGERRVEDITPSAVDDFIKEKSHFPDPELIIRFGEGSCVFGFLPWQIRLTEILSATSHHSIGHKSFTDLLHTYGDTKQRFGR